MPRRSCPHHGSAPPTSSPVETRASGARGSYLPASGGRIARINAGTDAGPPLHEYCHHVQYAAPGLNGLFHNLHRRRTAGEPRVAIYDYAPREIGRRDKYVEAYTGREYGTGEIPQEVFTVGVQQLFHPVHGKEYLGLMARDDPEMLDLLLGVLFRYDP